MSAYNRVQLGADEKCPNCGSRIRRWVQFKYGSVRQLDYQPGDKITWGANDVGSPGAKRVIASGHPEACPICGHIPEYRFDIHLENDTIASLEPAPLDNEYSRFGHNSFVVVD